MQRPTSRRLQGYPVRSAVLRGFPTLCRRKTWRPELEPACVAEFPQPAYKARAPNTEQFTACTLRIAPNDSEPFIVLHVYLRPAERIQRRAARPGSLERSSSISLDSFRLWCRRIRLHEGWFLGRRAHATNGLAAEPSNELRASSEMWQ